MSAVEVVFLLLSLLAVASALLVVSTDHLVHAALWLAQRWSDGGPKGRPTELRQSR
jgi:Ca2+/Na+ antiporter